jgi:hypothetical protein
MIMPPVLFPEFLAACRVDTVGVFAPMLGYAAGMYGRWGLEPGEWVGEVVHEPFKAKILSAAPAGYRLGVDALDSIG